MDIDNTNTEALATVDRKANDTMTLLDRVKVIADAGEYKRAGELWAAGKAMLKAIADSYDPIIAAAHATHKKALESKAELYDPMESALRRVKRIMADYDTEQERVRREEQLRLEAAARRLAEDRLIAEAAAAEADGDQAQADAILAEPVVIAPVILPGATPKIEGGPVYREVWKFRIVDAALIPREYLIPDEKKLGAMTRALKGAMRVPGVEAYPEKV